MYKQIDAVAGQFELGTLRASTDAIARSNVSDDSQYTNLENQLSTLNSERNALAVQMITALEAPSSVVNPLRSNGRNCSYRGPSVARPGRLARAA